MSELIVPDLSASPAPGYRYAEADDTTPPPRDYAVLAYRRGTTDMHRVLDHWCSHERLGPGDVSLLTRATESSWTWTDPVDVVGVYLDPDELAATGRRMHDHEEAEVAAVVLHDRVRADDPVIHRLVLLIAAEAAADGDGSALLVEALTRQLAVHVLRRHADVVLREPGGVGRLSARQERAVRDHVREHLRARLRLDDLARAAGLSRCHFARRFRATTGTTPHEFVVRARVDRARHLLDRTDTPLAQVAEACGFADQSHMNRVFAKRVGATPGAVRRHR